MISRLLETTWGAFNSTLELFKELIKLGLCQRVGAPTARACIIFPSATEFDCLDFRKLVKLKVVRMVAGFS